MNSRGFSSSVSEGNLPSVDHLTYEGVFNQLKFDIGAQPKDLIEVHVGYARYQFDRSNVDSSINDYLALFLKSSRDGLPRDDRPLYVSLCLDISGSMSGLLANSNSVKQNQSRLQLSIEAIKMFVSKLRPNDSVSIVSFNHDANVLIPQTLRKDLNLQSLNVLDTLKANGGTTIQSGFSCCSRALLSTQTPFECERRIIMMTDVEDDSFQSQGVAITQMAKSGVNLSIVGISSAFNSKICEKFKNIRGFNYFCAVNDADLKKYVFQNFDFCYFPITHDVQLNLLSQDVKSFQVFGSSDSQLVTGYNQGFAEGRKQFTVTKLPTVFPSEVEITPTGVYTFGSLILLKLKRNNKQPMLNGMLSIRYNGRDGKVQQVEKPFHFDFPVHQQFFSADCLREALQGYAFVSQMRNILTKGRENMSNQLKQQLLLSLQGLKQIAPASKMEDLQNVVRILNIPKQTNPFE